eukprot:scaffold155_cov347-Pavlova_lutheri.AAC.29
MVQTLPHHWRPPEACPLWLAMPRLQRCQRRSQPPSYSRHTVPLSPKPSTLGRHVFVVLPFLRDLAAVLVSKRPVGAADLHPRPRSRRIWHQCATHEAFVPRAVGFERGLVLNWFFQLVFGSSRTRFVYVYVLENRVHVTGKFEVINGVQGGWVLSQNVDSRALPISLESP